MRRLLVLVAVFSAFALFGFWLGRASADEGEITLKGPAGPTPEQVAWAKQVTFRHWHAWPQCGEPALYVGDIPTPQYSGDVASVAMVGSCTIILSRNWDWEDFPALFCTTYMHEVGHLILGPVFGAVNPADPWHSLDPLNVMNSGVQTQAQQEHMQELVGCKAPRPVPVIHRHHRQKRSYGRRDSNPHRTA